MALSTKVSAFNIGHFFNVATITNVVSATATYGIKVSKTYKDLDGIVLTGNFFLNVLNPSNNQTERIFVPPNGVSADGLTIGVQTTGEVTRGLKPTGYNPTDGSPAYAYKIKPGYIVAATDDPIILTEFQKCFLGLIATGGLDFITGDGTDSTVTIKHFKSGSTVGWLRRNVATTKVQFSNDGTAWVNMDNAGVGALTAGRYIDATALGTGTVQVNNNYALTTGSANAYLATITSTTAIYTTGEAIRIKANFTNSGAATIAVNGEAATAIKKKDGSTALAANDIISGEIYELIYDGTNYRLTQVISDVQATDLTDGGETILHSHASVPATVITLTAGENITIPGYPIPVYLADGVNRSDARVIQDLDNANSQITATEWVAQTFTADVFDKINTVQVSVSDTASANDLTCALYATTAGLPTGGALATATVATIAQVGATQTDYCFNFAAFSLTIGTVYALVFSSNGNSFALFYQNTDVYSGGSRITSANGGANWVAQANDVRFRIYGSYSGTAGRFYRATKNESSRCLAMGFITAPATAAASSSVYTSGILGGFTGLTSGVTYYLGTNGALVTTKSSALDYTIKLGVAVSTTQLQLDIKPLARIFNLNTPTTSLFYIGQIGNTTSINFSHPVPFDGVLTSNILARAGNANVSAGAFKTATRVVNYLGESTNAASISGYQSGNIAQGEHLNYAYVSATVSSTPYTYTCTPH